MALPLVTLLIAATLVAVYLVLTIHVIRLRRREHAEVTITGSTELQRAIRAHSNFMEYTPLFLIMLALLELSDSYLWWISGLGLAFLIGRISHAYGLLVGENSTPPVFKGRVFGMMLTLIPLTASALSAVVLVAWVLVH
ncbi:MAG: glutathione metabolism protein [Gammaproteobacteria bacterium]|nr:glutathione metabolism protein [Gammaproteobacteria bacterium]